MSPRSLERPDPLRVAFVMPGVGVVGRGAEAFVVELTTALAARGEVEPVIFSRGALPEETPEAVAWERIGAVPRDQPLVNRLYGATRLGRKVLDTLFLDPLNVEWATASLAAFARLARGDFDVVVMEGGLVGGWLARILRRLGGLGFVDVAHGNSPRWEGAFARQKPDRVVTFTEDTAAMIRRRAPAARIEVIPHGIDLERFHPDGPAEDLDLERPVVAVAGAVDANKRTGLAAEAVAALAGRRGRGSLLVLGEGPDAAALDRHAAELLAPRPGGPPRYRRLVVPRSAMPRWYRAMDVFTMPSKLESFGLTYLEALACGVPVVAPDDPVRREVIGDAGVLVDPTDREAYATALGRALDGPWGDRPRRRAEGFPFAATAAAYARLLRTVAAEHGRGPGSEGAPQNGETP